MKMVTLMSKKRKYKPFNHVNFSIIAKYSSIKLCLFNVNIDYSK